MTTEMISRQEAIARGLHRYIGWLCFDCNVIEGRCHGDSRHLRLLADWIDQHQAPSIRRAVSE